VYVLHKFLLARQSLVPSHTLMGNRTTSIYSDFEFRFEEDLI